jgi:hypothetical protein
MLRSRLYWLSVAALAAGISLEAVVVLAGPQGVASATTSSIQCKTLIGNTQKTVTLKGCSGNTGKASKPMPVSSLLGGGKAKWMNKKTTTIAAPNLSGGALCPAGDADAVATGIVTADTTKSVTIGSAYTLEVCVDPSGNVSLAPGTKAVI